jgi:DNA invertase Pin-like site-specific DNA recombinase
MAICYARVSTGDQHPHLQVDAFERAGCYRVVTETASGALPTARCSSRSWTSSAPVDTLVVRKLDRLGRSGRQNMTLPRDADLTLDHVEEFLGGFRRPLEPTRVLAAAGSGEIFTSRTVRDLVVGANITVEDRGPHALKGIEGTWQLFAITRA